METIETNRTFIMQFYNDISGKAKTIKILSKYIRDTLLIDHLIFFEELIPRYKLIVDEVTSEHNRVVVHTRIKGRNNGKIEGMPTTGRDIEIPVVLGYKLENKLIIDHWFIADQLGLLKQLGMIMNKKSMLS